MTRDPWPAMPLPSHLQAWADAHELFKVGTYCLTCRVPWEIDVLRPCRPEDCSGRNAQRLRWPALKAIHDRMLTSAPSEPPSGPPSHRDMSGVAIPAFAAASSEGAAMWDAAAKEAARELGAIVQPWFISDDVWSALGFREIVGFWRDSKGLAHRMYTMLTPAPQCLILPGDARGFGSSALALAHEGVLMRHPVGNVPSKRRGPHSVKNKQAWVGTPRHRLANGIKHDGTGG